MAVLIAASLNLFLSAVIVVSVPPAATNMLWIALLLSLMDFISRLIQHIPEKHFKMIRYGGLYARHRKIDDSLYKIVSEEKRHVFRSFNRWRTAILSSFGYDPLVCPDCGHKMEFLELYFNHQRLSLEELYEKAMSKSLGKRYSS